MSWSVSASGTPAEVRGKLSEQFKGPLAEKPAGVAHDGERETVQRVQECVEQILSTFGADQKVSVYACGSMGFDNYETQAGPYQDVNLKISRQS